MEELSLGVLVQVALAHWGVGTRKEVMQDQEMSMVLTVEVPDIMEEDSSDKRGSFGDPDQGVLLYESLVE